MAQEQGSTDMETDNVVSAPTGQTPTWSLAWLAEKLKKLLESPKQNVEAMECKLDKARKVMHGIRRMPHAIPSRLLTHLRQYIRILDAHKMEQFPSHCY